MKINLEDAGAILDGMIAYLDRWESLLPQHLAVVQQIFDSFPELGSRRIDFPGVTLV